MASFALNSTQERKRAGPPEDCGGVWGYSELLEIIADPDYAEHEDRIEWLGEEYNSEVFNLEVINQRLMGMQLMLVCKQICSSRMLDLIMGATLGRGHEIVSNKI